MKKIVTVQRLVFGALILVLFAVGCTDPTPTPEPATAPQITTAQAVATVPAPTAVLTKAATSQTIDQMWADLFVVKPVEEQSVMVDPGNGSGTILWTKKKPLSGTLYLVPIMAESAALRASATNPYTFAFVATALGLYALYQAKPNGSWTAYQVNAPTINLTPLLPASLRALMNTSSRYNVTINGKSVAMTRPYVSPDAAYTVVMRGQTVLAGWQAIKTLAEANPTGGITFKTGLGDVVAELTKSTTATGKPPDQCSWYWTVTVPKLKSPVRVCFDDLLPFIEALKNGLLPPGLSMVTPKYFALPA